MASHTRPYRDGENSDDQINTSMVPKTAALIQPLSSLSLSAQEGVTEIPITAPQPTFPSAADPFAPLGLAFGQVSEKGSTFVPFNLMRAFPRMYVGRSNRGPAIDFFKETLLRDRVWDIFSLGDPTDMRQPLLLVPTVQFEKYLDIATHELGGQLTIPGGGAGRRFTLTFGEWDTPCPRFLGRANSEPALEALKARTHKAPADDLRHLTPACYQTYLNKLDAIYDSGKENKKKKNPQVARQKMVEKQKDAGRMLKRVQRYLGLRRATSHASNNNSHQDVVATGWDVSKAAPFKPRESVRFVCVDVEAYEKDTRLVTEIGLAVLDIEDVIDICPGERGENWFSCVQAHHFRIKERSYMVNSEFVQGCPEAFDFGKTQMIPIKEINRAVGRILGDNKSEDKRPVIIVGHDIGQDLNYLLKIGYNPWRIQHIVDEIDTKTLFQRIERSPNGRGLALVCDRLGIPGYHYHNAGNDAVHTLRAMITMAIKRTVEDSNRKEELYTPVDEWSDGNMDDGGCPKRSLPPAEKEGGLRSNGDTDKPQNVRW
ncbi:hypothetical protein F4803DRAFT_553923 [Xylaria telfairii]|nr:hypothetical protein F4803DRAFT_553923 [Xylaria telfairii]